MARLLRCSAVAIVLLLLQPGPSAQQGPGTAPAGQNADKAQSQDPPAGAQPTFRAGINFVRVDVILTDKNGNPVSDLKQSDFEVLEDGKPQAIEQFRLVSLDGGLSQAAAEPPREIRTDADEELEAAKD